MNFSDSLRSGRQPHHFGLRFLKPGAHAPGLTLTFASRTENRIVIQAVPARTAAGILSCSI